MSEPTLLLRKTGQPWIDYHQFILFDVESRRSQRSGLPQRANDAIAVSGDGGATFFTLGDMTDVVVEFELWSTEPAMPTRVYADRFDGSFSLDTGRLVLGSTTGSPEDVVIDIPIDGPFHLRAFRNSDATVNLDFPDMDHHDEQWLLQAWPFQ